jgi:hypothetical protein
MPANTSSRLKKPHRLADCPEHFEGCAQSTRFNVLKIGVLE